MKFTLYNHRFSETDFFSQVMRMHDTRKDLGFCIFSWDQTEEAKKRVYPRDHMATGAYVQLEDGTEPHLQTPKYTRIEKILVVVENLEETIDNYLAYGFGPFSDITLQGEKYKSASFFMNTDGADVQFEIIQPLDPDCAYGKYLSRYGRGVYNVILEQNPEYNNVIATLSE